MAIEDNWWMFLVVAGVIAVLMIIACIAEKLKKNEDILMLKPHIVLLKIFANQVGFYLIYLFVVFAFDQMLFEVFYVSQLYYSHEFSFLSARGWINNACLMMSLLFTSVILLGVVQRSKEMLDYCFTLCFIHFVIVSASILEFPMNGAWWMSLAVGFALLYISSRFISHRIETMPYKSHMAGKKKKKNKKGKKGELSALTAGLEKTNNGKLTSASTSPSMDDMQAIEMSDRVQSNHQHNSNIEVPNSMNSVNTIDQQDDVNLIDNNNINSINRNDNDTNVTEEGKIELILDIIATASNNNKDGPAAATTTEAEQRLPQPPKPKNVKTRSLSPRADDFD